MKHKRWPNDLRVRKLGSYEIRKYQESLYISQNYNLAPSENFANTTTKILENGNRAHPAVRYFTQKLELVSAILTGIVVPCRVGEDHRLFAGSDFRSIAKLHYYQFVIPYAPLHFKCLRVSASYALTFLRTCLPKSFSALRANAPKCLCILYAYLHTYFCLKCLLAHVHLWLMRICKFTHYVQSFVFICERLPSTFPANIYLFTVYNPNRVVYYGATKCSFRPERERNIFSDDISVDIQGVTFLYQRTKHWSKTRKF